MIMNTDDKVYQRLLKKGSILKALRTSKGAGLGCIAGGLTMVALAVMVGLMLGMMGGNEVFFWVLVIMGLPGVILILLGIVLKKKRDSTYLSYYQKETGFSEGELHQIDRELSAPDVCIVGYRNEGRKCIACFITEHYFVTENGYVRRLEDILAVAYTDKMPWVDSVIYGLICLSKQDDEAYFMTFAAASDKKQALCGMIIEELYSRNQKIICGQDILCNDKKYNLMNDSKEIARLYHEGHTVLGVM